MKKSTFSRERRMTIIHGILGIVIIIVVLQFWLFTATMEAFLSGDSAILWPTALASLICLGLNTGLLWYLHGLD
jgi:hypothetical protein